MDFCRSILSLFSICFSSLPDAIRLRLKNARRAREEDRELVLDYVNYAKEMHNVEEKEEFQKLNVDRKGMIDLLAELTGETHRFLKPFQLLPTLKQIQKRQHLAPQTILNYVSSFKKYVQHCYYRRKDLKFDIEMMYGAIADVKKAYTAPAKKASRDMQ